jgi:FtsP/CotA-like multicopper oxidase with cupredoxin domain
MRKVLGAIAVLVLGTCTSHAADDGVLRATTDSHGRAIYELNVAYTNATLYDPMTGRDDKLRVRAYQGQGSSAHLVAPRIEAAPGETVRLKLSNQLPADDPSCTPARKADINEPHCFNTTNLHLHGLWISPSGNSDNVLLSIPPGGSFEYEYAIPADHPSGTFFYHTHQHGSTALQVSSGMAGAIIVRGNRLPKWNPSGGLTSGDIDTLLKRADGTAIPERVMLLQQIPYACRDAQGKPKVDANTRWRCDAGDIGEVENYDLFGQTTWDRSGRFTSINGQVVPTFSGATAGEPERWRVIHGGVRDSVALEVRKLDPAAAGKRYRAATADERRAFVEKNCTGPIVPLHSFALDGLTRRKVIAQETTILQPAYRQDLLVTFPEAGTYCVIDDENAAAEASAAQLNDREVLAFVDVSAGTPVTQPMTAYISKWLVDAAARTMPIDVRDAIVADLQNGLSLRAFVNHLDIETSELTGKQTLGMWYFNTKIGEKEADYQHEFGELGRSVDGKLVLKNPAPFDPNRMDRVLPLGGVEEWTLSSFWGGHPFHIHVNPFQVVSILDPEGRDVSGPGTGQFANLKGEWKDTLQIEQGYVVTFRTRYERYIGDFVLHCHILDHEDKGMMQNVRIAPAINGRVVESAHH